MRRLLLLLLGAYHLALGLFMMFAPESFYDQLATYGEYNAHYVRDNATLYIALGATLVVAAGRTSWQLPLLVFACIQYATHVLNHLWDIGDTDPAWQGPFAAISLFAIGCAIAWLTKGAWEQDRVERREQRDQRRPASSGNSQR